MSKRLILAIALSFLVMLTWSRLAQKFYPIAQQEVREEISPSATSFISPSEQKAEAPADIAPHIFSEEQQTETKEVKVVSHHRELVFSLPYACLKKVKFLQYQNDDKYFNLGQGFCLAGQRLIFTTEKLDSKEAIFVCQDERRRITKHFHFSNPNYVIRLDIKIENLSEQSSVYPSNLVLGTMNINSRQLDSRFNEIFLKQPDKILRFNPSRATKDKLGGEFFGFRGRYFCAILIPLSFPETLQIARINRIKSQLMLSRPIMTLSPGQTGQLQYRIYLGPQQVELLKSFQDGAEEVIFYGFFDPIAKLLLKILRFLYRLVHNWGWATVFLSVFIFIVLFPLSLKQMRSAKEMQHLQPKIAELRQLYKDNAQRLNKETMELYRKNKINPLGGCLPMFLQIPIFFSLYQALMRSIELKGAPFLWIQDLSQPDRLIASPEINVLPILMAITMFLQQKFSLMPTAGSSGEQQRLMSFLFPIVFGFIFYRMPSGLVLYWFMNSLLMFVHQVKLKAIKSPLH